MEIKTAIQCGVCFKVLGLCDNEVELNNIICLNCMEKLEETE